MVSKSISKTENQMVVHAVGNTNPGGEVWGAGMGCYYRTWWSVDLTEKVTWEQRPQGAMQMSGKGFVVRGNSKCKGPEVDCAQHVCKEAQVAGAE